ncbi:MAG TPA: aminoacyl-tRNA hydrolase [Patescibacteria group bacterium]
MQIIVGLGNPGKQYQATKHNVGFRVVEQLATEAGFPAFNTQSKFNAEVSKKGEVLLVKPQTFMNKSGDSVSAVMRMYKGQLYVIHDDLDIELGHWKMQLGTGPKIHNGLLSIYDRLGTKNFWHVRIGVDTRQGDRTIPSERYVLMPFTEQEEQIMTKVMHEVSYELLRKLNESI